MSIEKYTTDAIVIESYDQGEHDRVYSLFTRDFGLVRAHAKSIRKLESKLRAHVIPRSRSLVTLVKGKEVWRLVGAQECNEKDNYIHEITNLTKRFIKGEQTHKELFDRMISCMQEGLQFDEQKARLLIYYIFLVELGYADAQVIGASTIKEYAKWSVADLYTHLVINYKQVRTHVQEVLKEMQL